MKKPPTKNQQRARAYNHCKGLCRNIKAQLKLIEGRIEKAGDEIPYTIRQYMIDIKQMSESLEDAIQRQYWKGKK